MAKSAEKKSKFSKEQYLKWYESMLLMRKFEEKTGQVYVQQKIKGFCHLIWAFLLFLPLLII